MVYYIPITIILAAIDAWRIYWKNKRVKHPVGNNDISHVVSWTLGIITAAALLFVIRPTGWHLLSFAVGCVAIRGLLFDPFLNLFRRLPINYVSGKSSSITETGWKAVPFWTRRAIFASLLIVVLIVKYFIHAN